MTEQNKEKQIETVGAIMSTSDHDMFQFDPTQRPANPAWVKKLASLIKANNLLADWPIIVDRNYTILDGQHRLLAAKLLGVPIYFKYAKSMTAGDVAGVNNANRNWTYEDRLHSYAAQGKRDYQALQKFMAHWPDFSLEICRILLAEGMNRDGDAQAFKDGQYKIKNINFGIKMARHLSAMKKYTKLWKRRYFVQAVVWMAKQPEYDQKRMLQRMSYQTEALLPQTGVEQYVSMLERIYNYRSNKDKIVYFNYAQRGKL